MATHLVTGGAGFIGSHLVDGLVALGHDVVVLDDLSSGKVENLASVMDRVRLIEGDVCDPQTASAACRGVSWVFHLAALTSVPESVTDPLAYHRVDVDGTLNMLEAARQSGARRFLFAGSCAVYGDFGDRPVPETAPPDPLSPYAAAKLAAEAYVRSYRFGLGFDTVAFRFFNVFGPRQRADSPYAAVVPKFLERLISGGRPTIFGDGEQSRDMIYVGDLVRALTIAAQRDILPSGVYNIGSGKPVRVIEVMREAARALGKSFEPEFAPPRPGDILHSRGDVSRIAREIGFEPDISFARGMAATARWFQEHRKATRP